MGIFDFLKKKNKGIDENKFLSNLFQNEICALALWKLKENNSNPYIAIKELKKVGLSDEQIDYVLEKTKKIIEPEQTFNIQNTDFGISDDLLDKIIKKEISDLEIRNYFEKLFSFATYQAQNGKQKNALELYQKCLLINPNADEVYSNLSILNYEMNDFEKSLENINKAIEIKPLEIIYYKNKAVTCEHLELHEEEKKCYEKIVEIDSNNLEANFSLSQLNVQDNEFEIALKNLNKVIDLADGSDELFGPQLSKIGVLYELGLVKEAEDLYLKMTSFFPQEIIIHHIIPNLNFHKNKMDDAKAFFDIQYEKTKSAVILKAKADFFFDKDKTVAISSYDEYLKINPNDIQARQNRATLHSEANSDYDVNLEIEQILAIDPNNVNALFNKARILVSQKSYDEALKITEKIYSTDNTNMNYVGFILELLELYKSETEVENYIEKLKDNNPNESYNIEYRKGLYYKSKKLYDKAIQVFNSQNKIHEFGWNYYQIAIIKNLQGKTSESIDYLKKAFQLDPNIKKDAKTYEELENLHNDSQFLKITK
ncbi:tetratricopeptide (TPR) repeat protein [Epilithonimonas hungarica]|uniref:tetratricopeptide repeat protein n=1 Tax=Epilithonimonas hungarica TaxID=454006 RepID=UPI0027844FB2|nr:tetratricopeptide repeat protein [Epilithonimonas hungarica]MDP9957002.1 tetratricopeptide (TPR) repeat protein [Epilithonimonas hungarica]